MATKRVAVVFGGRSGEHEVSVMTARNVIAALDLARWQPMPCAIAKTGTWLSAAETLGLLDAGATAFDGGGQHLLESAALRDLASCDIAFPLVHGTYGEDGTMQGLFEMAGLPYTGCGVAASAVGLDKALMKALFREAGLPVPPYGVVRAWELNESSDTAIRYVESELGYPCFVKPANGGSSVGVSRVLSREDLPAAFRAAFAYDDKAVVEQAIDGQEVECSVLGNQQPEASIVGEVVADREFYDYDSKYDPRSKSTLHIPARIPEQTSEKVRELALRMYQVMGCEGYARVDFFVRGGTEVIANEVNTIPGFTAISMYPKLWEATGLGYSDLLSRIIELGFERHERRSQR
ncbi:MAG: D-alanine--D-alanine ligase family protein [Dehalococcoidia bacterium]